MALFRFSAEMIGEGIRILLFVVAITTLLFGLWPWIGGSLGVYALPAESTSVTKEAGVAVIQWDTQDAPSLSWIHVHVTADQEVDVRIVATNHRQLVVHNQSNLAVQEDLSVVAGGGSNGQGIGREVDLSGSRGGPTHYIIFVQASDNARLLNITDRQISYKLEWEIHKLDPTVVLSGLVLFAMFFVTEYLLHFRADIRALARRVDRMGTEGGAPARGGAAALGAPALPYAASARDRGPPVREEEPASASAFPSEPESPAREGRRRLFGRSASGQEVPPATEEEALPEAPPPTVTDPYAPPAYRQPSYAASAPPQAEEVEEPEYYPPPAPPAPARPAPQAPPRRAAPPPPPAPPRQAPPAPPTAPAPAAPPAAEPVTRVRCPQCKHIVPVYTAQRPTPIKCPNCGKKGMLTR